MKYISKKWLTTLIIVVVGIIGTIGISDFKKEAYIKNELRQSNVTIIFHKNGCPFCEAGLPAIKAYLKNNKTKNPTVYLETSEKLAKTYIIKYHVKVANTITNVTNGKAKNYLYAKKVGNKFLSDKDQIRKAFSENQ